MEDYVLVSVEPLDFACPFQVTGSRHVMNARRTRERFYSVRSKVEKPVPIPGVPSLVKRERSASSSPRRINSGEHAI
jgi:hypothetical protein